MSYLIEIRKEGSEHQWASTVSHYESKGATHNLEDQEGVAKLLFVCVTEDTEPGVDQGVMVVDALQLVGGLVEARETMAGTVNNTQQLRQTEHKVDKLWNEKQHHGLAEVGKDTHHRKSHAGTVAESVSHKDL